MTPDLFDPVFGMGGTTAPTLRGYQDTVAGAIEASKHRSSLVVMPTGSGKTIVGCEVIRRAATRALFLAPRRELVFQTAEKLSGIGVDQALLMSGERMDTDRQVQVACVPTMHARLEAGMSAPPADVIVVDEAHASFSKMTRDILRHYPRARVVGMTATPARSDGRGLGELYDDMIEGPSVADLTSMGYLVPVRYFAPSTADLTGVREHRSDYVQKDLAQAMNTPRLVGDVVSNWLNICPDRRTVVFSVDRAHAMALHQEFTAVGVPSAYLDGKTPNAERSHILQRIRTGEIMVICSVDVLSYGWDEPSVSCGIIARPTRSIARYLQSGGRILRPFDGKNDAILIDHSGVVSDLGFLDDPHPWSLDPSGKVQDRIAAAKEKKNPDDLVTSLDCPKCHAAIRPQPKCPECGSDLRRQHARKIDTVEAELRELAAREEAKAKKTAKIGHDDPREFLSHLLGFASMRGFKPGWAFNQYKDHFGEQPSFDGFVEPKEPPAEVVSWCRHRLIKWAKSKTKGEAA